MPVLVEWDAILTNYRLICRKYVNERRLFGTRRRTGNVRDWANAEWPEGGIAVMPGLRGPAATPGRPHHPGLKATAVAHICGERVEARAAPRRSRPFLRSPPRHTGWPLRDLLNISTTASCGVRSGTAKASYSRWRRPGAASASASSTLTVSVYAVLRTKICLLGSACAPRSGRTTTPVAVIKRLAEPGGQTVIGSAMNSLIRFGL
jgi:hypothetical protein